MKKGRGKIAVAILAAWMMVFTMIPGAAFAAESPATVKVVFSAANVNGFDMVPQTVAVSSDLTETYYPDVTVVEPKGVVTVSDVLVAAHIAKYGEAFKKNPTAYYDVENGGFNSGYVKKQFGHDVAALGGFYYTNNKSILTGVCKDTVKDGESVFTGAYSTSEYVDLYGVFDQSSYAAMQGTPIKVKIKTDSFGTEVVSKGGAKLAVVDNSTGKLTELKGALINDKGEAAVSFSNPGTYYISTVGNVSYTSQYSGEVMAPILGAYAKVTVTSAKPTAVKAKSASVTSVKVSWKKVKDATGYQVYRAASKNGKYKKVKTTSAASFTDKKLKTGKAYYYKVRAYKKEDGSVYYGAYSAKVKAVPKPAAAVLKLKAGKGTVKASWKKVSGADGYQVYRAKSKKGKFTKIKTVSKKSRSYKSTRLKKGKTYYYKVRAYKKVNGKNVYGTFSAVQKAKVK